MAWWVVLIIICLGILIFLYLGVPVAFAFGIMNTIGLYFLCGGEGMLKLLVSSTETSIVQFPLLTAPFFILMGSILTNTGTISLSFDAIDSWLSRIPGRLAVLTLVAGTLFAALSGSSMASCAAVGSSMLPEMERRGYDRKVSLGSIMAGGALAILIPPSALMVIYASLAHVSISKLLISGVLPGITLSVLFVVYVVLKAVVNPKGSPSYESQKLSFSEKIYKSKALFSAGILIFAVTGVIYVGICSPTEASGVGALTAFILALLYGRASRKNIGASLAETARISCMIFFIIAGSGAFGQVLSITGASEELCKAVLALPIPKYFILAGMLVLVFVMGCFMESISIMFIVVPFFTPIVSTLGFDPIWFGLLVMMDIELGVLTPPFGMNLFVMKGVAPGDVRMGEIYSSVMPFVFLHMLGIVIVAFCPQIALLLPNMMK